MCRFMSSINFGIFSDINSSHIFSATLFLFSPEIPMVCVSVFFLVFQRWLCFCSLFLYKKNKCLLMYRHFVDPETEVSTKASISFHGFQKLEGWGKHQKSRVFRPANSCDPCPQTWNMSLWFETVKISPKSLTLIELRKKLLIRVFHVTKPEVKLVKSVTHHL